MDFIYLIANIAHEIVFLAGDADRTDPFACNYDDIRCPRSIWRPHGWRPCFEERQREGTSMAEPRSYGTIRRHDSASRASCYKSGCVSALHSSSAPGAD